MEKKKYLRALRNKMRFKFSQRVVNNVIRDYDEYFELGYMNNETNEEMIKRLGTPEEVIQSLADEIDNKAGIKYIIKIITSIFLIVIAYDYPAYIMSNTLLLVLSLVMVICFSIGLWMFVGGDFSSSMKEDIVKAIGKTKLKVISGSSFIIYLISMLSISVTAFYIIKYDLFPFSQSEQFIRSYIFILEHLYLLIVPFILYTVYIARLNNINLLHYIFVEAGLLFSIRLHFFLYANSLGYEGHQTGIFLISLLPLAFGYLLSTVSKLLAIRIEKHMIARKV